jgi:quinol monooxygenase YgiN
MDQHFVSGTWVTKAGQEEEFVRRWEEFTDWSAQHAHGARSFVLVRDERDPRHFLSFGTWDDPAAIRAWRSTQEFATRLSACVELCQEFHASDYVLAAQRPQPSQRQMVR